MFAVVMFVFRFSVLSQEIGWEERFRNDLFCVGWGVKHNQSPNSFANRAQRRATSLIRPTPNRQPRC